MSSSPSPSLSSSASSLSAASTHLPASAAAPQQHHNRNSTRRSQTPSSTPGLRTIQVSTPMSPARVRRASSHLPQPFFSPEASSTSSTSSDICSQSSLSSPRSRSTTVTPPVIFAPKNTSSLSSAASSIASSSSSWSLSKSSSASARFLGRLSNISAPSMSSLSATAHTSKHLKSDKNGTQWRNHRKLIENVYPSTPSVQRGKGRRPGNSNNRGENPSARVQTEGAEDFAPNRSALSLLSFYASMKPHKLIKIGDYLRRKTEKELSAARNNAVNIKVTLAIIEALTLACTVHIYIMAADILRILLMVFENFSWDVGLVERASVVFDKFSSTEGATVIIDPECKLLLDAITLRFCRFSLNTGMDPVHKQRLRVIGLNSNSAMISLRGATVTHVADILDTIVFNIRDCLAASLSTTGTLFAKTSDGTSRPRPVSLQPSFLFMSDEVRAAAHLCLKSLLSHGAASLPTSLLTAKTTSTKATRLNRLRKRSVRCEAATLAPGQGEFAVAPGVHGGVSALMDAVFDALHRVHEAGIGDANPGDVLCGEEEESGSAECVLADIVGAMVANLPPMLHANLVREVVERIRDLCNSATDSENASGREASRITALIRILSDLASPSSRSRAIREERTQSNAAHVGLPVVDAAGAVGLELNSILETIVEVTMTFTNPLDRSVSNAVLTAAMELVRALSRSAQYREQVNDILVHLIKSTRQPNPQLGGSSDQTSDEKHQSVDGDCIEVLLSFSTASLQVRAALVARRMVQSTWSTKSAILSCLSSSEEADSPSASLDLAPLPCEYLISLSTALLGHERAEVRTRAAQVVTSILLQEASERPRHLENPYGSVDLHRDTSLGRISHSTHSLSSRPVSTAGVLGQGATQSTVMDESCDARDSLHHHLHRMLSSAQCTPDDVVSGLAVSIACTLCGGPLEIEEHVMFWLTVEESLGIDSPESHQIRASLKFALRSYVVWAGAYFEQPALLRLGRGSIPSPSQATEESDFPNFLSHSTLSSHLFMRPIMPLQQSFWPVVWPDVVPLAAFPFISRDEVTAAIAAPSMALPATVPFGKNSPGPIGRSGSEGEGLFGRAAKTSRKGVVESGAATSLKPKLRPLSLPSSNSFGHVLEGGKPVGLLHSRAKGLSPQATRTARAAPSSANVRTRTASATTANVAELLKAITVGSGGGRGRAGTAGPFGGEREASTAASAAAAAAAGVEPGVFRLRFGGEPTLYHHREFSGRPPWAEEPLAVRAAGGRES